MCLGHQRKQAVAFHKILVCLSFTDINVFIMFSLVYAPKNFIFLIIKSKIKLLLFMMSWYAAYQGNLPAERFIETCHKPAEML